MQGGVGRRAPGPLGGARGPARLTGQDIYIYIYIYMFTCMYIYIYIYIHIDI